MSSAGRIAVIIGRRSLRIRPNSSPKTFGSNHASVPAFSSPTSQFPGAASRFAPVLGSLLTMLPLHSTIAAARLKSNIVVDTSCWSWLSQATRHDRDEGGQKGQPDKELHVSIGKKETHISRGQDSRFVHTRSRILDEKVKEMKDQVIRVKEMKDQLYEAG